MAAITRVVASVALQNLPLNVELSFAVREQSTLLFGLGRPVLKGLLVQVKVAKFIMSSKSIAGDIGAPLFSAEHTHNLGSNRQQLLLVVYRLHMWSWKKRGCDVS